MSPTVLRWCRREGYCEVEVNATCYVYFRSTIWGHFATLMKNSVYLNICYPEHICHGDWGDLFIYRHLRNSFIRRNCEQTSYHLRNSKTDLTLHKPKKEFLKRNIKYRGAKIWKLLLNKAKLAESFYSFKVHIKK